MARINGISFALASISLLLLCNIAVAQVTSTTDASITSSTAAAPVLPVSCQNATAATVNGTLLLGTWYEAARKPVGGGVNTEQCVQMILDYNNGTVSAQVTYAIDPNALWLNQTITNNVIYNASDAGANPEIFTAIFNITINGVNTTFKILDTDYNSYAFICGYLPVENSVPAATTTASPSSTTAASVTTTSQAPVTTTQVPVVLSPAGAFIITRQRQVNSTALANLTANALASYSDFKNISTVTQSSQCTESGAGTTVPVLAMVMAIVYSLLKFVH